MALDGIGAMLGAPIGPATATEPTTKPAKSPADLAKERAEASAARQKQDLAEVREKGLYAWAQEKKFEALKAQIEKEMKAAKGIDDASLAAMSPEERAAVMTSLEAEIAKRIQEVMKDTLTEEAKTAAKQGRPPTAMIIDIAV
jgi:anti-sigma28 factor (negative regulator of flagellin synthesis)